MKNEEMIKDTQFISNEDGAFSTVYNTFYTSELDLKRSPIRHRIFSYMKDSEYPVLFRHYSHRHDDTQDFNGYTQQTLEYCKMYVFIEGKVGILVNDNLYTTSFGKIITLRINEKSTVFFYAMENLEYYEIDFPVQFFNNLPEASPFHKVFFEKDGENNALELSPEYTEKMFHIFAKLDSDAEENNEHRDMLAYSHLIQLFSHICDGMNKIATKNTAHKLSPTLKIALSYISDNYLTINDTKQIAEHCHISVSYLCRLFKASLGISPIEYINTRKLSKAKFLLKNGHNVTESCYESGFNSYNYFISTFKRFVGQTPTEFQKSEMKEDEK